MSDNYSRELQIAIQAVKNSEKTFRKYFGTKTEVEIKRVKNNFVSYADKKIEKEIKDYLLERLPTYGFIGEESKPVKTTSKFSWVLDPIDGTANYIKGDPYCCTSLALIYKNESLLGFVNAPFLKQYYYALAEGGAFSNTKRIKCSNVIDLKKSTISLTWARDVKFAKDIFPTVVENAARVRVKGSTALNLCYVAEGIYDLSIEKGVELWDYAAGQIILEEAGGIVKKIEKHDIILSGRLAPVNLLKKKIIKKMR